MIGFYIEASYPECYNPGFVAAGCLRRLLYDGKRMRAVRYTLMERTVSVLSDAPLQPVGRA